MNTDVRADGATFVLRVTGTATLAELRAAALDAVLACRDSGMHRLLLDLLDARVEPVPALLQRIDIVQEWAEAAPDGFSLALAAREELLHSDRAGLYVASRLGLDAHAFTDRASAERWLREPSTPAHT